MDGRESIFDTEKKKYVTQIPKPIKTMSGGKRTNNDYDMLFETDFDKEVEDMMSNLYYEKLFESEEPEPVLMDYNVLFEMEPEPVDIDYNVFFEMEPEPVVMDYNNVFFEMEE